MNILDSFVIEAILKLMLAMLCGGAIGMERELSRKPAGLRTNVLICVGAAFLMIISRHISISKVTADPARLAAQIVSGIGFLGGGVILRSRGSITGLTTAATIFVVAAIGIGIGEGLYGIGIMVTVLIIFVLVLLRRVERSVLHRRRLYHFSFETPDPSSALTNLISVLDDQGIRLEDFSVQDINGNKHKVGFSVVTSLDGHTELIKRLPLLGVHIHTSIAEETD